MIAILGFLTEQVNCHTIYLDKHLLTKHPEHLVVGLNCKPVLSVCGKVTCSMFIQ